MGSYPELATCRVRPVMSGYRHRVGAIGARGNVEMRRDSASRGVAAVLTGIGTVAPGVGSGGVGVAEIPRVGDTLERRGVGADR